MVMGAAGAPRSTGETGDPRGVSAGREDQLQGCRVRVGKGNLLSELWGLSSPHQQALGILSLTCTFILSKVLGVQ